MNVNPLQFRPKCRPEDSRERFVAQFAFDEYGLPCEAMKDNIHEDQRLLLVIVVAGHQAIRRLAMEDPEPRTIHIALWPSTLNVIALPNHTEN